MTDLKENKQAFQISKYIEETKGFIEFEELIEWCIKKKYTETMLKGYETFKFLLEETRKEEIKNIVNNKNKS